MHIASLSIDFFVIEQTAHNLGVPTSVSAPEISDLLLVSVVTSGVNLSHNHLTIRLGVSMTTSKSLLRFPLWRLLL